jgi:hypothetical protein
MAKWPQTGSWLVGFSREVEATLVATGEADTTLVQVIADLDLVPLSADDEEMIRFELGALIAAGYRNLSVSAKYSWSDRVTVAGVQKALRRLAKLLKAAPWDPKNLALNIDSVAAAHADLDEIERFLPGIETGLRTSEEIAVAGKIMSVVVTQMGNYDRALAILHDYRSYPALIAKACRRAVEELGSVNGKRGRPSMDWSGLLRVARLIAERNGIEPKIVTNRETHEVEGRFIEIAEGLERLLLPRYMRIRNRPALAKRLQRAESK